MTNLFSLIQDGTPQKLIYCWFQNLKEKKEASKSSTIDVLNKQESIIKQHLSAQLSMFRRAWLTESGWRF